MKVLLLQLDGKLPNIALMRLAAHHRERGDDVVLQHARSVEATRRTMFDDWGRVYASLIFTKTQPLAKRVLEEFPEAIIGGTGWNFSTLEEHGITTKRQDYSDYPAFRRSLGFSQRGCRLDCWFCVVPKKEGKVREEQTIGEIWRGEPWPREVLLLDNDFFGQPRWRERIQEIRDGGFKVSFNQGINARMLSDEAAEAIASVDYRDDGMKVRRIYTAWDSIGDEGPLFRGLNALVRYGVARSSIMVYMLLKGPLVTDDDLRRREKLREFGCLPYPMPYEPTEELRGFQRWVLTHYDQKVSWERWKEAGYQAYRLKWAG